MASGSASLSSASATPAKPPAPPEAPCLPKYAADGRVVHTEARGEHVLVCFDSGAADAHCVEADPGTGAVNATAEWRGPPDEVAESGAFTAKGSHLAVDVCSRSNPTSCRHVPTPSDPLGVAVNDDGTRTFAFIAQVDSKPNAVIPWRLFGEVYDTATGKRLARGQLSSTMAYTSSENVYFASYVGPSLLLRDETSDRSAGIAGVWDGRVSRAGVWGPPGPFVKLDGSTWASASRESVTFVDVAKTAEAGKALENPMPSTSSNSNVRAGLIVLGDKVVWTWGSPAGIVTFDRRTHAMGTAHPLTLCH